jgi:hypothetical protein
MREGQLMVEAFGETLEVDIGRVEVTIHLRARLGSDITGRYHNTF